MNSGSAIIMTTAANLTHQHAVLPEPHVNGERVSIVFRNIKAFMTRDEIAARVRDDE
jgi:hypothetical protein